MALLEPRPRDPTDGLLTDSLAEPSQSEPLPRREVSSKEGGGAVAVEYPASSKFGQVTNTLPPMLLGLNALPDPQGLARTDKTAGSFSATFSRAASYDLLGRDEGREVPSTAPIEQRSPDGSPIVRRRTPG